MATFYVEAVDAAGKPYRLVINDQDAEFIATGITLVARTDVSDYDGVN